MAIGTSHMGLRFSLTNCYGAMHNFVCQKIYTFYPASDNEYPPLKVDVPSRILEYIGDYGVNKFFLSRNYKLTTTKALIFCNSLEMNLVIIDSKEKFNKLIRALGKEAKRFDKTFSIDGSRSSLLETQPWINIYASNGNQRLECLAVTSGVQSSTLYGGVFSTSCNSESNDFICESKASEMFPKQVKLPKFGLKKLGTMCKF